jgi:hypothetical protein
VDDGIPLPSEGFNGILQPWSMNMMVSAAALLPGFDCVGSRFPDKCMACSDKHDSNAAWLVLLLLT